MSSLPILSMSKETQFLRANKHIFLTQFFSHKGLVKTLRKALPQDSAITINIHSPLQQQNKILSLLNQMTSHFQAFLTKKNKLEVVTQTATPPPFSKIFAFARLFCRDVTMAHDLESAELTNSPLPPGIHCPQSFLLSC